MRQLSLALVLAGGCSLAIPERSTASEIGEAAIRFEGALLANRPAFAFGWDFSLSEAASIEALGVYDPDGDGLGGRFEAGLYDSVGRLLAQTAIEGSGDAIKDAFTWRRIPRLELPAGLYTVAAAGVWAGGDKVPYNAEQLRGADGVTYLRPRFRPGVTTLALPLEAFPAGISVQGYWAASFALADDSHTSAGDVPAGDAPAGEVPFINPRFAPPSEASDPNANPAANSTTGDPQARSTPAPLTLLGLGEAMRRSRKLRRRSGHSHLQARGLEHHRGAGAQAPALEAEVGGGATSLGGEGLELDREAGG